MTYPLHDCYHEGTKTHENHEGYLTEKLRVLRVLRDFVMIKSFNHNRYSELKDAAGTSDGDQTERD